MQRPGVPPDLGAHAMHNAATTSEVSTIATAQLIGGLSGMLVSEGLNRLLRETMGVAKPAAAQASEKEPEGKPSESEALAEHAAKAFKEMVMQGAIDRIMALQTVNTYLSMATSEQLRRWGAELLSNPAPPAHDANTHGGMPGPFPCWPPSYYPYTMSPPSHRNPYRR